MEISRPSQLWDCISISSLWTIIAWFCSLWLDPTILMFIFEVSNVITFIPDLGYLDWPPCSSVNLRVSKHMWVSRRWCVYKGSRRSCDWNWQSRQSIWSTARSFPENAYIIKFKSRLIRWARVIKTALRTVSLVGFFTPVSCYVWTRVVC